MKSFIPYHCFFAKINIETVEEYFLFKGLMNATLMKNVEQVEAGSLIAYDLLTNDITKVKYFDVESYKRDESNLSCDELKDYFWETFCSVVRRQTISDVKVGCQLSGGIDSSILAQVVVSEGELETKIPVHSPKNWNLVLQNIS